MMTDVDPSLSYEHNGFTSEKRSSSDFISRIFHYSSSVITFSGQVRVNCESATSHMNARRPDQRTNGQGPSEGHFLGLLTSGQRMESPGSRLIIKVTVILAELVSGGLGFHETQLPERILQSEDARCVMVGCFAVGGASVEAYIRMLGCTLTNELASQMNWTVGDRKISMNNNKKKTHLETPGSKMCMMPINNKGKLRKRRSAVTVQKWLACGHCLVVESPEFIRLSV